MFSIYVWGIWGLFLVVVGDLGAFGGFVAAPGPSTEELNGTGPKVEL